LDTDRNHIVVFRFSALGDIAMTVPVIKQWLYLYPKLTVTVVSNPFAQPLFDSIARCNFIGADFKGKHAGFFGLFRLYKEIKEQTGKVPIADLHNVLRTTVLKSFFRLSGFSIATIDKGRREKRNLTSRHNKIKSPLPSQHERYADVFRSLGYPGELNHNAQTLITPITNFHSDFIHRGDKVNIGIAPFAKHQGKCYPPDKMKEVVQKLSQDGYQIFLFGGGKAEIKILSSWISEMGDHVKLVAGNFSFKEELEIISQLDVMCSMDSANMHLASLFSIPVISIWGATHPFAGFLGFGQSEELAVSLDLPCSPCSVFGNKPCWRGDFACMNQMSPQVVYSAICQSVLRNKK
jgi:ADP-heptose:LPS heptosyltransferase